MDDVTRGRLQAYVQQAVEELECATAKFGPFMSMHEGYAVILEELDEAWDAIKQNDRLSAREEMRQVAAMALRFLIDCKAERECDVETSA